MSNVRRIQFALLAVLGVVIAGSIGYVVLGFSLLDAVYQTVTTITTVGFREVRPLGTAGKIFTIVLILAGVGTALYTFSVVLESLVEGHLRQHFEGRRMERDIARMSGHTIVCGWGRVGRSVAGYLAGQGTAVVVVDLDPQRAASTGHPALQGDVTDDEVLRKAGIMRARALVAAINTDAENVYVTLRPGTMPGPHHRRPGPHRGLEGEAATGWRDPGGESAADRRPPNRGGRSAAERGGVS